MKNSLDFAEFKIHACFGLRYIERRCVLVNANAWLTFHYGFRSDLIEVELLIEMR